MGDNDRTIKRDSQVNKITESTMPKLYDHTTETYRVQDTGWVQDFDDGDRLPVYKVTALCNPETFYLNREPHFYVSNGETFYCFGYPDVEVER